MFEHCLFSAVGSPGRSKVSASPLGSYRGYTRIMEKKMETTI